MRENKEFTMIGLMKTFAILGTLGGAALLAQPAKADNVRVGFGVSVPVMTYAPAPVYYRPAPVVNYVAPTYTYVAPATTYYSTPTYYAPPVVYSTPAPVVVAPAVPYYAPVYSSPGYYSSPGLSFNLGFLFGGHDHGHGGGHHH
jgi:hypothetical protein